MSNNPLGPDAPRGDNAEPNDFAAAEDFLGLHADPNGRVPEFSDHKNEAGFPTASLASEANHRPPTETQVEEDEDLDEESLLEDDGEAESSADEDFDLDLDEEGASWLMEFDGAESDEEQEEAFAQAFEEDQEEEDFRPSLAEPEYAGGSNPWLGRALLAMISVAVGVVGSKYLAGDLFKADPAGGTEIAQNVAPTPAGKAVGPKVADPNAGSGAGTQTPGTPVSKGKALKGDSGSGKQAPATKPQTKPQAQPKPDVVAVKTDPTPATPTNTTAPKQPVQAPGALAKSDPVEGETNGLVIQVDGTAMGDNKAPVELTQAPGLPMMEEEHGRLRTASATELATIWKGDSIPREAVHGDKRLLTPEVGDVRVLLYAGEVFEGKLYAVGNRRIWLETKIGKMALLEWQIDSFEKIAEPGSHANGNESTLAGLQSVRVRTAGGVFYGKLVSQRESTIIIITPSGARLTLENAEVASAGRSTSHVVDTSGLIVAKTEAK